MKYAFIYTRTLLDDRRTPKSDRAEAQRQRCADFLKQHNIIHNCIFHDCGDIHPVTFSRLLRTMLDTLRYEDEHMLVIADHPGRLGRDRDTQDRVIKAIAAAGGKFIWPKPRLKDLNNGQY